jgi:toxin ParE1/3/4
MLFISDESELDILDAYTWYERRLTGLGEEFEASLEKGFETLLQDPFLFQTRYRNLRIYFIEKFPFGIHYLVDENSIKVFGVFHTSLSPRNWLSRLT